MNPSALRRKQGFTLVELLVVISIIAILSVIGITIFSSAQKSARDARRRADLKAIANALEQYKASTGSYPATNGWAFSHSAGWSTLLSNSYVTSMPLDPQNAGNTKEPYLGGSSYGYYNSTAYCGPGCTGGTYFMLVAHLESPNSADKKTRCVFPDGTVYGSTDSGAPNIFTDNFFVCNQQ